MHEQHSHRLRRTRRWIDSAFLVGRVVVTERVPTSALQVRDVVVFHRPDKPAELVVHRIIVLTPSAAGPIAQTQGDANDTPDPWNVSLHGATAYRAVFSLPLIGDAAVWAHGPAGPNALVLVGLLLIGSAAVGAAIVETDSRSHGLNHRPGGARRFRAVVRRRAHGAPRRV